MSRRLHALFLGAALATSLPAFAAPAKKAAAGKKDDKKDPKKKLGDKPSAADAAASTKKLEETLKKTEEPEEATRLAPAKLDVPAGKEVTKDALADQRRDEAIAQIQKIMPKQKSPAVVADLLFQLAELWWEKSRFVKMAEEMPAYQKSADEWVKCRMAKGDKACGAEPRPNNRKSELYRKNAVDLYTKITKEYSSYNRLDEIYYILAFNKYDYAQGIDSKKEKDRSIAEAIDSYRKLIALYPKSPFVPSAYVQLGNFYFDNNQLPPARKAFDEAVKFHDPKTETYAIYKLAWCDINSGDYDSALKRFSDVVVRGNRTDKAKEGEDKIKLKNEAMRDIIRPFVELDIRDKAIKFYSDYAGNNGSWKFIKMLADAYFNAGGAKYDTAIWMYRYMIKERGTDANAPEWQSKIVLALDKQNQRAKVLDEMRILVNNYKPGTAWYVANKSDKRHIDVAYSLTEEALYGLVTDYHQEAIKTKSVATYQLARDIYREYIDNFPESERAYQMRYYYAEILYALEEYQVGYEQYLKVALDKEHDDYKKVSATNMLLSAEKLVDIEAGRYKKSIDHGAKIDENKAKGDVAKVEIKVKIDKNSPPQKLTELEQQMVAACDKYNELVPGAEDEARVRLRASVIYFDRIQYVEAATRFGYIINKWPEEKTSATAAALILESLEVREEWASLNKLSREFSTNKKLLEGKDKDEFKKKLPVYIEGSQFKIASEVNEKDKDFPKAAKMFRDFVQEFPKSKFAPIGLANAFYIYQNAKQLDTAIEMGEKMFADYATCDTGDWLNLPSGDKREKKILPDLLFSLAKNYEQTANFAIAAAKYEKFVADYKDDDRAPDAQFNAAHWYEGLGESDKALKAFDKYIVIYKEKAKKPEEIKRLNLPAAAAVFYEEAIIVEGTKNWPDTVSRLKAYQSDYPSIEGWQRYNARYKQFLAATKMTKAELTKANVIDPQAICDDIVKKHLELAEADKKKESTKLAIAHCRFLQLEVVFNDYSKTQFKSASTFKADYEKKNKLAKQLKDDYGKIVDFGNGDYAIAALFRMALLPKLFAKSLLDAPMPKGLDDEQQELYRATLETKALEFEEPAIDALELALNKAFELQIYNEWTIQAEDLMKEFKPDAYADVKEFPLKGTEFFFTAGQISADGAGSGGDGK